MCFLHFCTHSFLDLAILRLPCEFVTINLAFSNESQDGAKRKWKLDPCLQKKTCPATWKTRRCFVFICYQNVTGVPTPGSPPKAKKTNDWLEISNHGKCQPWMKMYYLLFLTHKYPRDIEFLGGFPWRWARGTSNCLSPEWILQTFPILVFQMGNLMAIQPTPPLTYSPRNKGLIRPYEGKPMVNKPLIRPYFWGGGTWPGGLVE